MTDTLDIPESAESEHSLRAGVLGLFDSVIMGIAGVAPGYSIAASTAVLFGAVVLGGAAALLYCGIAMFGIVFAFSYLGRVETNAGASYSWVRRALHPGLGSHYVCAYFHGRSDRTRGLVHSWALFSRCREQHH
jgi:amino acid transporter